MSYKKSGVDTQAADQWVERLSKVFSTPANRDGSVISGIGSYAAVYRTKSPSQCIALSCDGIGSKLLWSLEGLGSAESLAQDLVAMNNNDLLCVGARPSLFMDYLAVASKELLKEGAFLDQFIKGLAKACKSEEQLLVGGETAQLPDLYEEGHFDVAGFSLGFLNEGDVLSVENIQEGQSVWGLKSSGPHSNGFSWLRKLFTKEKDADLIREHLMAPTLLYQNPLEKIKAAITQSPLKLAALFHITGSGLLNLLRAQPAGRTIGFDLSDWPKTDPKWMQLVSERSQASQKELFSAFNMGFGLILLFNGPIGEKEKSLLESLDLRHLGRVVKDPHVKVRGLVLE